MKATFDDFIASAPIYKKFQPNKEAQYIFDNILSKDKNIIEMIHLSNHGIPALCACINQLETYYSSKPSPQFDLTDNFTKQALGTMVRVILEPFGYTPNDQKNIPDFYSSKLIKSATTYSLTNKPTMKVVRVIKEV